jgi:hypothetical protein
MEFSRDESVLRMATRCAPTSIPAGLSVLTTNKTRGDLDPAGTSCLLNVPLQ